MKTAPQSSPGDDRTAGAPRTGEAVSASAVGSPRPLVPAEVRVACWRFAWMVIGMTLACGPAWGELARAAWHDALHSYAVAIPLVCAWLAWQERDSLCRSPLRPMRGLAWGIGGVALLVWLAAWRLLPKEGLWPVSGAMAAWTLGVWAAFLGCFGGAWMRQVAFAAGFLAFAIPFPEPVVNAIETTLQYSTAVVVDRAFWLMGVTYAREGQLFWLPGLRFEVAQQCSGIRSSLVLFITSLVGAKLLLQSPTRRALLALAVIPLGILRNAFRICVITLLTVKVDPQIIHSALHHRGGPLFFVLSLIPLFFMLWWFRRSEAAASRAEGNKGT